MSISKHLSRKAKVPRILTGVTLQGVGVAEETEGAANRITVIWSVRVYGVAGQPAQSPHVKRPKLPSIPKNSV
jgi:hypothetical protein